MRGMRVVARCLVHSKRSTNDKLGTIDFTAIDNGPAQPGRNMAQHGAARHGTARRSTRCGGARRGGGRPAAELLFDELANRAELHALFWRIIVYEYL